MENTFERFSLLLLEPQEIYFTDYYVDLISEAEVVQGKLKICSKSLVFEAKESPELPIIRITYRDCDIIRSNEEKRAIEIRCKAYSEMLEGNVIAPYKFHSSKAKTFLFVLNYVSIEEVLPRIEQLQRASTLPIYEQNAMIATIVYCYHKRYKFNPVWMEDPVTETIVHNEMVNQVQPLIVCPGNLVLTNTMIYFQQFNNVSTYPVLKIKIKRIKSVLKRRFLLKPIGLEIRWHDRSDDVERELYVSFSNEEGRNKFMEGLLKQEEFEADETLPESITLQWQHGLISNFDYLLYLNSIADRSFNDLTQYPVFPWILTDYESQTIDLTKISIYRDLGKPIGALNSDRLGKLKERFGEMTESNQTRFLYGSHYSSPGFVIFYLARKYPKLMLCLQNGRFDHPDRIFNSITETFNNCLQNMSDFKELIPEFYDNKDEKGGFLVNKQKINFGLRYDGTFVNNVVLPPWANGSPETFVNILRTALESDYVSANLHKWVDLIFGYKQRGQEAIDANNLFYHLCYEGSIDLDEVKDLSTRHALEVQILEFGQIPKQLFTTPHASKLYFVTRNISRSTSMQASLKVAYESHRDEITSLAVDTDVIIGSAKDGAIMCYDLRSGKRTRNVLVSDSPLSKCVKIPDSPFLLLGSWANEVLVYNLDFGNMCHTFEAHDDAVSSLKLVEDFLFTSSWDGYLKVWKVLDKGNAVFRAAKSMTDCVSIDEKITCFDVKCQNEAYTVVIGLHTGDILLWRFQERHPSTDPERIFEHKSQCDDLKFSGNGHFVVTSSLKKGVIILDSSSRMVLFERSTADRVTSLAWSNNDELILIGDESGKCLIFNMKKGDITFELVSHTGCISSVVAIGKNAFGVAGRERDSFCLKVWELQSVEL